VKTWKKEEALKILTELIDESEKLKPSKAFSTEHTFWLTKCHTVLGEVFGNRSLYYRSFAEITWKPASGTPIDTWSYRDLQTAIDAAGHPAYLRDLGVVKGLLLGAIEYLKDRDIKDAYSAKDSGNEANIALKVIKLIEQKLRKLIREKPEKEKTIQDAFENLLIGADISYSREADSIEYSSKKYIPDFSLAEIDLAVEIKLCGHEQREKELPEEINDDILAYKTKYKNLIFVVYDLGVIRDQERFCGSFEKQENVMVKVVKH
jgi:hypothetical protein